MKKEMAFYLAFCLVSLGIILLLPTGCAQPYGGSVWTGDEQENHKDYFDREEDVYYYIEATENGGAPLQDADIRIEISGPVGIVHNVTIHTDIYGRASGFWHEDLDKDIGTYTLYANYTIHNIGSRNFRIYTPIPRFAEVETYIDGYRDSDGTPGRYFSSDELVFFSIYVTDQHGNPFEDDGPVYYEIGHNGQTLTEYWWTYTTDSEGYIDDYYEPGDITGDAVYGLYYINVTDEQDFSIGNTTFEVVDVSIDISPYKTQYVQGEEITIVVTSSVPGPIDVRILDPDKEVLPSANWVDQDLINSQWTSDYILGTGLPDGEYEIQVIKDDNLMESNTIVVKKYALNIWTDSGAYLPGETMTVFYTITNNKDGSGVDDATLQWIFQYYDEDVWDLRETRQDIISTGSFGDFKVTIPKSASGIETGALHVWANDTSGRSDLQKEDIDIGEIVAQLEIDDDGYLAGDFILVEIEAMIDSMAHPLKNGDVHLNVSKEGVELRDYTTSGLKTDERGRL
ncbi:MAG: hypothetical protein JSW28_03755, partial [Thermoplasmata archaeon]